MTPNISIENKNILIFHTHSCESYTSSNAFPYTPTGTYRTTDLNYTVTSIGTEISAIKSINQEEAKITQETNNSEEKNTENQQTYAKALTSRKLSLSHRA